MSKSVVEESQKEQQVQCSMEAQRKVTMPLPRMFILGVLAGAFIALGAFGSQYATVCTNKVVGALVFPIGLFLVVCTSAELFTGNCLLFVPLSNKRIPVLKTITNLIVVYLGNAFGAIITAIMVGEITSTIYNSKDLELLNSIINTAQTKMTMDPQAMLIKAIFCNMLVCLAVWLAKYEQSPAKKALALWAPTFLFVLCGFEHSIANWYFIPAGILIGADASGLFVNILIVTLGNLIGGILIAFLLKLAKTRVINGHTTLDDETSGVK